MNKLGIVLMIMLVFLVPTSLSWERENTYADMDFEIPGAGGPGPPVFPGGGGGVAPGEAVVPEAVCGDGKIQAGESCWTCPTDYATIMGPNFCIKIIEKQLPRYNLTIHVSQGPAQLVIEKTINITNQTFVIFDGYVNYTDTFILTEGKYTLRISKSEFEAWETTIYLSDDETINVEFKKIEYIVEPIYVSEISFESLKWPLLIVLVIVLVLAYRRKRKKGFEFRFYKFRLLVKKGRKGLEFKFSARKGKGWRGIEKSLVVFGRKLRKGAKFKWAKDINYGYIRRKWRRGTRFKWKRQIRFRLSGRKWKKLDFRFFRFRLIMRKWKTGLRFKFSIRKRGRR